jgi:3-oxoacyl-[acyl-carrier-protein] synthase III
MKAKGVGILGLGLALPEKVRKNSEWPREFVEQFEKKRSEDIGAPPAELLARQDLPEPVRITIEELGKWVNDPFRGSIERRVLADGMRSSDLEAKAALDAIQAAKLEPKDIDLMLITSLVPDQVIPNNGGVVHKKVGLPRTTPAMGVDGGCGGFFYQLQLAASCIASGNAKHVLIVQSAVNSLINDFMNPQSATLGDAATAAVVGPVAVEKGVLGAANFFDGSLCDIVVVAPKGRDRNKGPTWYRGDDGPFRIRSLDYKGLKESVTTLGTIAKESIDGALADASLSVSDVQFFASHQTFPSYNTICRRAAKLEHARTMDTYRWIGSVMASSIPANLYHGVKEGLLRDGDVAAMFTTGAGQNWGAMVLRWGR